MTLDPAVTRTRRKPSLVALVLLSSLAGLLLAELTLRLQEPFFHVMAGKYNWAAQWIADPVWDHMPAPNTRIAHALFDLERYPEPFVFETNSHGVRYPRELAVPKPQGVTRVLVMGDSFTEGYYHEDTVAGHLERRLAAAFPGRRFEAINAGVSSYSPILHYLRLKHQLLALEPDAVILNIDPSDVFDDYWRARPQTRFAADGEPLASGGQVRWYNRVAEWVKHYLYLARVASWFVQTRGAAVHDRPERGFFDHHWKLPPDSPAWQAEVGFCLVNLRRIVDLCRARGIDITITTYPHRQHLRPDSGGQLWHRAFEARLAQFCAEQGVPFFSAFDGMARAFREGGKIFWDVDFHYTPLGQRIWAGLVADNYIGRMDQ